MPKKGQKNKTDPFGMGDGYPLIFDKMTNAAALHKIVLNKAGRPIDYIFLKVNKAFEQQTGLKAKDIIGKKVTEVIPGIEKDPADWIGRYGKISMGEKEQKFEQYAESLDKTYSVQAYSPQEGYFMTVFEDISQAKEYTTRLELYRSIIESSSNEIAIADMSGVITYVNDAWANNHGYKKENLIGKSLEIFHSKEELENVKKFNKKLVKHGKYLGEVIHKRKNGQRYTSLMNNFIIYCDGKPEMMVAVATDISERKQAQRKLEESEKKYSKIIEEVKDLIWSTDMDGNLTFISPNVKKILGYDEKNLYGKSCFDLMTSASKKEALKLKDKFKDPKMNSISIELEYINKRGKVFVYDVLISLEKNKDGIPISVHGVSRDITEKKKAEEKYNILANNVSDGIFIHKNGTFLEVNKTLAKMTGYTMKEMIGKPISKFVSRESFVKGQKNKTKVGIPEEYVAVRKDGSTFPMEIVANNIEYEGEKVRIVTVRDIEERKKAETQLIESEEKYRITLASLRAGVVVHTADTRITFSNQEASNILGLDPKQMLGKKAIDPKWRFVREDGTDLPLNEYPVNKIISTKKDLENFIIGVNRPDRKNVTWVIVNGVLLFTRNKEIDKVVINFIDITDRKESEESLKIKNFVFDHALVANSIADKKGNMIEVNQSFLEKWGFSDKKEVLGKSVAHFFADQKEALLVLEELNKTGEWKGNFVAKKKNGSTFIAYGPATTLLDDYGNIVGYQSSVYDITKEQNAQKEIDDQKRLLESISDSAINTIFAKGMDRKYSFVNVAMEKLVGMKRKDLIGKTPEEVFPKDVAQAVKKVDALSFSGKQVDEYVDLKLNKKKVVLHVVQGPLRDEKNNVIGVSGVVRDVTKEKSSERTLMEERKRSSQYLEVAPVIIIALDAQGKITLINKKGSEILGYKDQELIGQDWFACCLPSAMVNPVREVFEKLIKGQSKFVAEYENPVVTKQGREKLINWNNTLLKDENGKVMGILSSGVDITDKKKIELALKESEERFRDVALSSSDWLWEVNTEGQYTYVSSGVKKVLGYTSKELLGKTPFDFMSKKEAQRVGVVFQKFVSGKEKIVDLENWNITKDGKKILFLTNGVPVFDSEGKWLGYRGVDKDITDVYAAKEKLLKHAEELERMNKLMIGREKKMAELKEKLKENR